MIDRAQASEKTVPRDLGEPSEPCLARRNGAWSTSGSRHPGNPSELVFEAGRATSYDKRGGGTNMTNGRVAGTAMLTSGLVWLLASCQAVQNQEAQSTEQVLAAAGFQMKEATTPQQLANLEAMTQRKIVIHDQNGQPRYVYADAEGCKCV